MSNWFIVDDKGLDGPFTLNELTAMLRDGELGASEYVQQGRDGKKVRAKDVPELRSAASTAPRRRANQATSSSGNTWLILLAVFGGVTALGCFILLPALLLPAVQQVRTAARRSMSQDHLHNLAIGFHSYESSHRVLPPGGIFGEDGSEYHGWPTFLLPHVDQQAIYMGMDVDNTRWRDPAISALVQQPIPVYMNPSASGDPVAGGLGPMHYSANKNVCYENSAMRISDMSDGLSNTMLLGEISSDYPAWASPHNFRDLSLGFGASARHYGSPIGLGGAQISLGDGRVVHLADTIDPNVLKALSTPQGGESATLP